MRTPHQENCTAIWLKERQSSRGTTSSLASANGNVSKEFIPFGWLARTPKGNWPLPFGGGAPLETHHPRIPDTHVAQSLQRHHGVPEVSRNDTFRQKTATQMSMLKLWPSPARGTKALSTKSLPMLENGAGTARHEQANQARQAGRKAGRQAGKQASKQASKQSSKHTNNQTSKQATKTNTQTIKQSNNQTNNEQTNRQTDNKQTGKQANRQASKAKQSKAKQSKAKQSKASKQARKHTVTHTHRHTHTHTHPLTVTHPHTHTHRHTNAQMRAHRDTQMHIYIYIYICVPTHTHRHADTQMHAHRDTHKCTYIYIYIYIYICVHASKRRNSQPASVCLGSSRPSQRTCQTGKR